jgi:quercetin dioxygenase-like cupin family protein
MNDPGASVVLRQSDLPAVDRGGGASTVYLVRAGVGAASFMNGITRFEPGAAIPPHSHNCEESVIVLEGEALYEDEAGSCELVAGDTVFTPAGRVHRVANRGARPMSIHWTYGSAEATRTDPRTGVTAPIGRERSYRRAERLPAALLRRDEDGGAMPGIGSGP